MSVRIRQTDDTVEINELERRFFYDSPPLKEHLMEGATWWVAEHEGMAVAFAGAVMRGSDASLIRSAVMREARGLGLQKRLIRVRLAWAKKQGALRAVTYTHVRSIASMRSLVSCGFKPSRLWSQVYLDFERKF